MKKYYSKSFVTGAEPFLFLGPDCKTETSFTRGQCSVTCGTGVRPVERVVTVTQQKRGLGKECKETPGKWQEQQECNTNIICPTEPPETPDETTDGTGGIGVRNGFGGKQLFINDDTLGKASR